MANPHTAEELARLSTLAHNVIGWLLLLVAGTILVETRRGFRSDWRRYFWPGTGLFIGFGLTGFVALHFVFQHRVSPFLDAAQNQHQLIGLFLGLGALGETLRRVRRAEGVAWKSAWPVSLLAVGGAFLIHEQGTTEALLVHWALAGTLILAGAASLASVLANEDAKSTRILAALLLGFASLQLIAFEETVGAHGDHAPPTRPEAAAPATDPATTHANH